MRLPRTRPSLPSLASLPTLPARPSRRRPTPHPYLDHDGPIAFAHRGGAVDGPENTIRAFQAAVGLGYEYLETDVRVTSDGVLLAFHDDDLRRTCGVDGRISELRYRDVAAARVGGTEPIPRLDDVFEQFPDTRFNIDCKSDAALEPLAAAVERHDVFDRVCLASFADRRLRTLRQRLGRRLCTSAGMGELSLLWTSGASAGAHAAQVPVRQGRLTVVTEKFVRRAHALGIAVHVWTIDDPDEMRRLLDLGVDGLMTDRPEVLRDVLIERHAWPG